MAAPAAAAQAPAQTPTPPLVCASKTGARTECPADTSAGVALLKSTGPRACLLGKTWGYDDKGVWVADGCSGEFLLGQRPRRPPLGRRCRRRRAADRAHRDVGRVRPRQRVPGRAKQRRRAVHQRLRAGALHQPDARRRRRSPITSGNERTVDGRNDIYPHRVMVFFKGWLGNPKLIYAITFWTVNSHRPERHLRQPRLPVQPEVQPLRRPQRESRARARCRARIPTGSATIA